MILFFSSMERLQPMGAFVSCNRGLLRTAGRLMAASVIILLLNGGSCPPLPGPGRTYACGDATSNHCYGIVRFNVAELGNGLDFGLFSTIVNAVALLGGDGEINDEIWVKQRHGVTNCGNQCWVEVGLSAGACSIPKNETHVFWADNRPFEGFFCHDMGPLQEQEFGHLMSLLIRVNPSDPGSYDVVVQTCLDAAAPCPGRRLVGQSTDNAMFPDTIDMGMELAGSTGAGAPGTNFFGTRVAVPGGSKYLDVDGTSGANSPITAEWDTLPTSGTTGGSFRTLCCF
jgi:hypothetical protein